MPIYTRKGDGGITALFGGKKVSKADLQVEAYGMVDELTVVLGMLRTSISQSDDLSFLEDIQRDLYIFMGFLAHAPVTLLEQERKIDLFEKKIDTFTQKLPPLSHFILPNGSLPSCWAHMARVTCRRAERSIVRFFEKKGVLEKPESQTIVKYMNRLSDLLFTYARILNREQEAISKKK